MAVYINGSIITISSSRRTKIIVDIRINSYIIENLVIRFVNGSIIILS